MKQLVRLQAKHAEIKAAGGTLVAISADTSEQTRALLEKLDAKGMPLTFPLVSDPNRAACKALGVYDKAHDIALPAIVILDREGKVAWTYAGENVFDRPEEAELIKTLQTLSAR
ncbi:MAG: peroxiredoxin family protein [Planctomycetes bacterium]|nr:peroxiredoxin family protein [Planctomycetota bacterium]